MVFSGANNVGSDFRGNFTQIKDTSRDLDDKFFGEFLLVDDMLKQFDWLLRFYNNIIG